MKQFTGDYGLVESTKIMLTNRISKKNNCNHVHERVRTCDFTMLRITLEAFFHCALIYVTMESAFIKRCDLFYCFMVSMITMDAKQH